MTNKLSSFVSFSLVIFMSFGWHSIVVATSSDASIKQILKSKKLPEGVVFEILHGASGLTWAIPKIKKYVAVLRKKWPSIKIAVVSHGDEQFALTKKNKPKFKKVHTDVKQLSFNFGVPVHICQTYAEMKGVSPEAFPKYVIVSQQGPQEIKNYQEFGYILVKITQ